MYSFYSTQFFHEKPLQMDFISLVFEYHYTTPKIFSRAVIEVVICDRPFQLRSAAGLRSGWPCQVGSIPVLLASLLEQPQQPC